MCFLVYTLHAGKWCRWCQWQRPKRTIKNGRERNMNICIRGAGNPVFGLVLCPWMQPNPNPVWSRKNYFSWVIIKNKLAAGLTLMFMHLLLWNIHRLCYLPPLFCTPLGTLYIILGAEGSPCRNLNRRYLLYTFSLLLEQLHIRPRYHPNRPPSSSICFCTP